ncbi:MAG TPA: GNAT family N-acetyltransferase [Thermoanaerobaculia bacterium]|nr:GNAT family N-acetyltransferase [Thermoanaerobaculia bacterium]
MPADAAFVTRAYEPGDESAILDLFARAFHAPRSLDHFRWKYLHNPYGNAHISLTFDATGKLVAQYAGYPVPVFESGRTLIAHQIADTMTDASIRHIGRGTTSIFAKTAFYFYTQFCEHKIAYNYGFNAASSRGFSLRFLRADCVEPVTYRLRTMPIPGIARLQRWLRGYQLELVAELTDEYDRFFDRVAPAYPFLVRRDARYLRWRYLECPDPGAFIVAVRKWRRLVGWSVFRVRENRLAWGDALFDPASVDAIEVLIRHVAPSYPVERVEGWFPQRPQWFADALARLGFVAGSEPRDLSLMCVPFELSDATQRMRDSLYYTMGDSDLF